MASTVSFSLHKATAKRKHSQLGRTVAGCFSHTDEEQTADLPPQKRALLLEDSAAKAKRLQDEGNVLAEAGRFRAAMSRWQEAVVLDETNAALFDLQAQAAMALCEDFQAVQYAIKATQLAPKWGEGYHTLARCHVNFGELELAYDNIMKAIDLDGLNEELQAERDEIQSLLDERSRIIRQRDDEAQGTLDGDMLQVVQCKKHLSLRGHVCQ